jgi:hypothetical protein
VGRRRIDNIDTIRIFNSELGIQKFHDITSEDLTASGRLVPIASRHFSEKAETLQNLLSLMNSSVGQDGGIRPHISGKTLAALVEELLGLEDRNLFGDNVQVNEGLETLRIQQAGAEQVQVEGQTPTPGVIEEDELNLEDLEVEE